MPATSARTAQIAEFVGSQPRELAAKDVVSAAQARGLRLSTQDVYNARSRAKKGAPKGRAKAKAKAAGSVVHLPPNAHSEAKARKDLLHRAELEGAILQVGLRHVRRAVNLVLDEVERRHVKDTF